MRVYTSSICGSYMTDIVLMKVRGEGDKKVQIFSKRKLGPIKRVQELGKRHPAAKKCYGYNQPDVSYKQVMGTIYTEQSIKY